MKIVFHERYLDEYSRDPAAKRGRLDKAWQDLRPLYELIEPDMAEEADILRVHSQQHFEMLTGSPYLFMMALLSAGGAIAAAELAVQGEPAFALIRPPGHHATVDDCWGFCWFNNMAIALERLRQTGRIETAFILDIDLHFGDGTQEIFAERPEITYFSLGDLKDLPARLEAVDECDILGISAGFDRHALDWGGLMETEDYRIVGRQVAKAVRRLCPGKVFALLEGGYNPDALSSSIKALLEGLEDPGEIG